MSQDDGKTEDPTPRKLREGRKDGQFARTQDAATWVGIAAGTLFVPHAFDVMHRELAAMLAQLPQVAADPGPERVLAAVATLPRAVLLAAGPAGLAAAVGAAVAMAAQGLYPSTKAMHFKKSRLSLKEGVKRMAGARAAWEAVKALVKVLVLALVVVLLGRALVPELVGRGHRPAAEMLGVVTGGLRALVWSTCVVGLLLAGADYAFQRRTVMKQLRMTPREIKDENRQAEGDPLIKGAIRSRQLAMGRNRMLAAVADADVVLANPTHVAVALRYEPGRGAPRVVAKGTDLLALKIRERAAEHRVPVVEDKPLARLLHRVCDVDDEIPAELYTAVARILAFVFSLRRPGSGVPRPGPTVLPDDMPGRNELRVRRSRERREGRRDVRSARPG